MTIEFVSHPVEPSAEPASSFTIDPNQILSTIFKFPSIFPTTVTDPDPTTVQPEKGDIINVNPENEEDNLYDDFDIVTENKESENSFENGEVVWKSKPPMQATTVVPEEKIKIQGIEEDDDEVVHQKETTDDTVYQKDNMDEVVYQKDKMNDTVYQKDKVNERKESGGKMKVKAKFIVETTTPDKQVEIINLKETSQVATVLPSKLTINIRK